MAETPTLFSAGRYGVVENLGSDGSGEVYRVRDARTDLPCVIKVLNARLHSTPKSQSRLVALARTFQELEHPNIVRVHQVQLEGKLLYAVCDPLPGENLAEILDTSGPLSPRNAARISLGLLDALSAIHRQGHVLKGLVVGELRVDEDCRPSLSLVGRLRGRGLPIDREAAEAAEAPFRAPELDDPMVVADERTDLYSVGQILGVCLGEVEVPAPLEEIRRRATAAEPSQRYASAEQMREALAAVLDQLDDGDAPFQLPRALEPGPPPLPDRRRALRRSASVAFLGLGGVFAIAVGVAVSVWGSWSAAPVPKEAEPAAEVPVVPKPPAKPPTDTAAAAPEAEQGAEGGPKPLPPQTGATGTVRIETRPAAALLVDGFNAGATPRDLVLTAETHTIDFTAEGYRPARMVVYVTEGQRSEACWDFVIDGPCL